MLGIFLIYFIGKKFAELAKLYDKHGFGFGVLGVISYYFGTFIFGILFIVFLGMYTEQGIDDVNELMINLLSVPIGLLTCWGFYRLLESNWKKKGNKKRKRDYDLLDDDFLK